MDGWIKLHRQIVKSSKFADPDIFRLWILCLVKASHKGGTVLIEKQEVHLEPGQFVTGRFSLADDYNEALAPRKKIKDTTLWSWLKRLEQWGDLDINSTNKFSVITVLKWYEYQESLTTELQQTDNSVTTEQQQTDTNKNVKNEKNVEKVKKDTSYTPEFERFWDAYPKQIGKPAAFNNFKKLLKKHDAEYIVACCMNYASYCMANGTDKQFIKMPNNFLNAKDEYYKQYETPVLIHSRSRQQPQQGNPQLTKLQQMHMEAEARDREASGHY